MSRITDKTKLKEKRGTGYGANYKPWILAREMGSNGTSSIFNDWKHGRAIQCLSQSEAKVYHLLRWHDEIIDIREQFPLELDLTLAIASELGLPHPHDRNSRMTTDFLVTHKLPGGEFFYKAYNVKPSEKYLTDYAWKNIAIERRYWELKNIELDIILADSLNKILVDNIKQVVRYYDPTKIRNRVDFIKCLIARKIIKVDMETRYLNFPELAQQYLSDGNINHYFKLLPN